MFGEEKSSADMGKDSDQEPDNLSGAEKTLQVGHRHSLERTWGGGLMKDVAEIKERLDKLEALAKRIESYIAERKKMEADGK